MGVVSYKDKAVFKCDMCKQSSWGVSNRFLWIGHITKEEILICSKCAQREAGKKKWIEIKEGI
jgi:hypothetical protein